MKGNTQDLTKGSIVKAIILFSIPLLIGNLFQQLYNAVDSYVVGNYVGKIALAAVGASTPIINMLIGFFMGISCAISCAQTKPTMSCPGQKWQKTVKKGLKTNEIPIKKQEKTPEWAFLLVWSR